MWSHFEEVPDRAGKAGTKKDTEKPAPMSIVQLF